ncbi:hypothetical protein ACH4EC_38235 [Streptomyces anulatus]
MQAGSGGPVGQAPAPAGRGGRQPGPLDVRPQLDPAQHRRALLDLAGQLGTRLRTDAQAAAGLTITIRYADGTTTTRTLPEGTPPASPTPLSTATPWSWSCTTPPSGTADGHPAPCVSWATSPCAPFAASPCPPVPGPCPARARLHPALRRTVPGGQTGTLEDR